MNSNIIEINFCLVCGSDAKTILFNNVIHTCGILKTLKDENEYISNVNKCIQCGHSYLSPVLKSETILEYYSKLNSEYFDNTPTNSRYFEELEIFKKIQTIKPKGNVLEIGCGNGFQLSIFQKVGYNCTGIEPSPKAQNFAREKLKLNVIQGFLEEKTFENESFDIILLMDVIEHLYNPNELISICSKLLKKDGLFVILTGDIESSNVKLWKEKWFYFYSWEHISFFNYKSINYLLEKHNLKIDKYIKQSHTRGKLYNLIRFYFLNPAMYIYNFWIKRKYKHISLCNDHMLVFATK